MEILCASRTEPKWNGGSQYFSVLDEDPNTLSMDVKKKILNAAYLLGKVKGNKHSAKIPHHQQDLYQLSQLTSTNLVESKVKIEITNTDPSIDLYDDEEKFDYYVNYYGNIANDKDNDTNDNEMDKPLISPEVTSTKMTEKSFKFLRFGSIQNKYHGVINEQSHASASSSIVGPPRLMRFKGFSFLSSSRKLRRLSSFSTSKRKKKKRSSRNQRKHTNVYQSPHTENDSISSTASSLFILDESSISQSSINCVNIVGIDKSFNLHSDPYVVQCDEEEDLQNTTVDFSEVDIDIVLL
jgi:hypothetical protein